MQREATQSQRPQQPRDQENPYEGKVAFSENIAKVLTMIAEDIEGPLDIFKGISALIDALHLASISSGQHRYGPEGFMVLSLVCRKGIKELEKQQEEIDTTARKLRGELQS